MCYRVNGTNVEYNVLYRPAHLLDSLSGYLYLGESQTLKLRVPVYASLAIRIFCHLMGA